MKTLKSLSRRRFLRGLGAVLPLPLLDIWADPAQAVSRQGSTRGREAPLRTVVLYLPNGVYPEGWFPGNVLEKKPLRHFDERQLEKMPPSLAALEPVRSSLTMLCGLTLDKARPNGDGAGDHARSAASFLTCSQAFKTEGRDIRTGISMDQLIAAERGGATRWKSMELGLEPGLRAGGCDSGYSCAYSSHISWSSPQTPMPTEIHPGQVYEKIFGSELGQREQEEVKRRQLMRLSLLDVLKEQRADVDRSLGARDRQKLDEYYTSIREVERRIHFDAEPRAQSPKPTIAKPAGVPEDFETYAQLMLDLMMLALQADVTRVSTLMFAREGSDRRFPSLGIHDGHHTLSHHDGQKDKVEKIRKIDTLHASIIAKWIDRMSRQREQDRSLLDSCQVLIGSGICDGHRHDHANLPILLVGRAGGKIRPGRLVRYPAETPLANLYLSMMGHHDLKLERFADSTGFLPGLV